MAALRAPWAAARLALVLQRRRLLLCPPRLSLNVSLYGWRDAKRSWNAPDARPRLLVRSIQSARFRLRLSPRELPFARPVGPPLLLLRCFNA